MGLIEELRDEFVSDAERITNKANKLSAFLRLVESNALPHGAAVSSQLVSRDVSNFIASQLASSIETTISPNYQWQYHKFAVWLVGTTRSFPFKIPTDVLCNNNLRYPDRDLPKDSMVTAFYCLAGALTLTTAISELFDQLTVAYERALIDTDPEHGVWSEGLPSWRSVSIYADKPAPPYILVDKLFDQFLLDPFVTGNSQFFDAAIKGRAETRIGSPHSPNRVYYLPTDADIKQRKLDLLHRQLEQHKQRHEDALTEHKEAKRVLDNNETLLDLLKKTIDEATAQIKELTEAK